MNLFKENLIEGFGSVTPLVFRLRFLSDGTDKKVRFHREWSGLFKEYYLRDCLSASCFLSYRVDIAAGKLCGIDRNLESKFLIISVCNFPILGAKSFSWLIISYDEIHLKKTHILLPTPSTTLIIDQVTAKTADGKLNQLILKPTRYNLRSWSKSYSRETLSSKM